MKIKIELDITEDQAHLLIACLNAKTLDLRVDAISPAAIPGFKDKTLEAIDLLELLAVKIEQEVL